MANLLKLPTSNEDDALVSLADWVELTALFSDKKSASKEDLRIALQRAPDPDDEEAITRRLSDESAEARASDVFSELRDRVASCGSEKEGTPTYPFVIDEGQAMISMPNPDVSGTNLVYLFLLGITASSMDSRIRKRQDHDPTKLFERLCADVLRKFWGGTEIHSDVMIFGTASNKAQGARKFRTNIDALCKHLGEGIGWKEDARAPGGGDGSLDLVAWRRFRDKRHGALVGFAQCKTGTHWRDHLTELVPSAFTRDYMQKQLIIDPIRIYMVPSRISRRRWVSATGKAGLLVDRCRITQYATEVSEKVLQDCKVWLDSLFAEQTKLMKAMKP